MWRQWRKPKLARCTTDCMTTHLCGDNAANQKWQDEPLIASPQRLCGGNAANKKWQDEPLIAWPQRLCGDNAQNQKWQDEPLIAWPLIYVQAMTQTKNDKVHHWLHHHSSMWRRCCKQKNNQDVQTNADALVPFPTIPNRVSFLTSAPAATSSYPVSSLNALVSITFRPFCASSLRTAQFVDAPLNIVPSYQSPPNPFQGSYPLQLAHSDQQRLFLYRKNN